MLPFSVTFSIFTSTSVIPKSSFETNFGRLNVLLMFTTNWKFKSIINCRTWNLPYISFCSEHLELPILEIDHVPSAATALVWQLSIDGWIIAVKYQSYIPCAFYDVLEVFVYNLTNGQQFSNITIMFDKSFTDFLYETKSEQV